ncbi:hypothetical protein C8A00DRAFT_45558 [Chaetomidium leptoderma]|uniref:Extracellular matrix protein n=1 Tax=Chaetomidium leptoderma TaxID=669021 RepID=A0AAN6ZUX1_9PEZI|nr:hypothetical protein C8A00DRAFT_45558 [Chaetomidium leptoderma]
MKFSVGTVLAFAAAALAKPVLLNSDFAVEEGKPFTLKWNNAEGPVTVSLMKGDPLNLDKVEDILVSSTATSFTWTPTDLPSGTYAFAISDTSADPLNYSQQFEYVGTGPTSSSSSVSSSASHSSTSASVSSTASSTSSSESSSTTSSESTSSSESSTFTTTQSSTSTRETTEPSNTPLNTNDSQRFASPIALVLVTVAALLFFN